MRTPAPIALTLEARAMSQAGLLEVQHAVGNRAATAIVQRQPGGAVASERRTLRFGSTGEDVKQLQMKLGRIRERQHDRDVRDEARIDGIFGPLTRQDVVDFQGDTGLDADGIVGPKTWDAIDSLVPGTVDVAVETASADQTRAAQDLVWAGQYDAALAIFEVLIATATTPEDVGPHAANAAVCHQQRGRFGLAVGRYEQALAGRFNQESMRAKLLGYLMKARRGEVLDFLPPDLEPLPPGADAATAAGREGGGVTERQPAKSGDSGPSVDLFKGKLAHMMVGWRPAMPEGDAFDAPTMERTRAFQQACGLEQTGEADASTWHALDSFTRAEVTYSIVQPLQEAAKEGQDVPPEVALPMWEGMLEEEQALGLTEMVKTTKGQIGYFHHKLQHFAEAIDHYEVFLGRIIPAPRQYGAFLEALRKARRGEPPD